MLTITDQLQLIELSPRYLSRSCSRDQQLPEDCRQPISFQASTWDRNGHICTFDRVNHQTLAKELLDRNMQLHIVKLFIYCYREQELIVRWDNSLSMTFRCSNGIMQGGQISTLLYNVYADDLNHHLHATGVGCHVEGGDLGKCG